MQTHDFNPGISANGVFWTIPLPPDAVSVDFEHATATMKLSNVALNDYFTIVNALVRQAGISGVGPFGPAAIPATASCELRWSGVVRQVHLQETSGGFRGQFLLDTSQVVSLTAAEAAAGGQPSFQFTASGRSTNEFSLLGHEQNGRFAH